MRTLDEFTQLIESQDTCPPDMPAAMRSLWYDKKGQWDRAHDIVQNASDADSAWVHAYLHRKEGDYSNARYWYRRSGQPAVTDSLPHEWEQIARNLLLKQG
ncbi:hypothetical protein [Phormidium sp. CCY1219]|uniref:hypothetical protein n=1 Tax=Phormidium sp. CCY1219 TaxID=2886104 RepID=UPI002D1EB986|nr:hypothetical protein [Phormidium sp. CCY1219]MEB3830696.1 hypothetical protein [Phormidium sp. CCY1219]